MKNPVHNDDHNIIIMLVILIIGATLGALLP